LLYLYVRALTTRASLGKKTFLHFVPSLLCVLYLIPFYLQSAEYKRATLPLSNWYYARSALVITQFLIYLVLIVMMLVRYAQRQKQQTSSYEKAVLFHIKCFVLMFSGIWVVGILRYAVDLVVPGYMRQTALVLPLAATALVYVLAYLGLRNSEAITGNAERSAEKKYESSTLTPERAEKYLKRLRHSMESEKAYTDGNLTLQKLADQLSIPAPHLSQVVNEQLNQNILDFINTHRVEEVKRRLLDPHLKHLSILAIAEDAGFNSKSSFNAVFKKHTNLTPSEYRKSARPATR
jgi:AraC-like DNA-binding protein